MFSGAGEAQSSPQRFQVCGCPQVNRKGSVEKAEQFLEAQQGHWGQAKQKNQISRPEISFCFPPLLFSGCSGRTSQALLGMNLHPRPVTSNLFNSVQLFLSKSFSPKNQSSLPAKSRLIVYWIGPSPGVIQLPGKIPLILQCLLGPANMSSS